MAQTEWFTDRLAFYHRDMTDVLPVWAENSIDAAITDPPYGLAELPRKRVEQAMAAWLAGDRTHVPDGRGFMGRDWDKFVPPPGAWDEVYRVLKPGGYLLAFAATRTMDLMGLSIRLAGFEVLDGVGIPGLLAWTYGSGFPKSLDIGKAIDKQRHDRPDILRVTSWLADICEARGIGRADVDAHMGTSDMGGWWLSRLVHRCAVPTWEQWLRLRELIGFSDEMDAEVWRLNGRKGTPGEAWDQRPVTQAAIGEHTPGGTISWDQRPSGHRERRDIPATPEAARWDGFGTALKPAWEPVIVARKPLDGTYAANVLKHGAGAMNVDGCRVGTDVVTTHSRGKNTAYPKRPGETTVEESGRTQRQDIFDRSERAGRWPPNLLLTHHPDCNGSCAPGCPVAALDEQSGTLKSGGGDRGTTSRDGLMGPDSDRGRKTRYERDPDSGGASRFFPQFGPDDTPFRYQAKAPKAERPRTADGKSWPTVKPQGLMRWLVRLVVPPGGTCLDPFAGTSATGQALLAEGMRAVLCERDPVAAELSLIRLALATPAEAMALVRGLQVPQEAPAS